MKGKKIIQLRRNYENEMFTHSIKNEISVKENPLDKGHQVPSSASKGPLKEAVDLDPDPEL